jgi:hypothetical protein
MMARFWLATFELPSPQAAVNPVAAPILAAGGQYLAIEVLADDSGPRGAGAPGGAPRSEYAVLFSTVDDPKQPTAFTCLIGFASGAKACSVWHDRGFPLVDAKIVPDPDSPGTIRVFSSFFEDSPSLRRESLQYESQLLALIGIESKRQAGGPEALKTVYRQVLGAPDGAQPDILIRRRAVSWTAERADTYRLDPPPFRLELAQSRWPDLAPLERDLKLVRAWSGTVRLPQDQQGNDRDAPLRPVRRADIFGPAAFRFENVEVLGFRVDLSAYGRDFTEDLDRLVKPLNFHLESAPGPSRASDFRYRAATRTLLIELLRYGSMKLQSPSPPLDDKDYQSQHELVVRLLVGRVDDDTAQAREPAVYVPAIFVDNPWSKVLGRDLQGFDKRMANFCVAQDGGTYARLLPDGRVAADAAPGGGERTPRPLGDVSLIRLVDETGSAEGPTLLEFSSPPLGDGEQVQFETIDLGLALGSFSLSGTRWRQSDFDQAEFRRSFARSAVTQSLQGFRSIQVSPVAKNGLEQAWINGTFTVDDDFRIAMPSGVVSLTMHAVPPDASAPSAPSAPDSWNRLCRMLGDGRRAEISLPTGSWYRLLFSMDLSIDNGLRWSGPDSS